MKAFATVALTLGFVFAASSLLAQAPAPSSCEENLKMVIQHDQDLQNTRQSLEIKAASLAVQLQDKDREIAKLRSDLAKHEPKAEPKK